jgi:tetratricopeptide (TPR) repeat protein
MKKILSSILFVLPLVLLAQEDDSYNLDYNNSKNATELCTKIKSSGLMSNAEADDAMAKILSVVGASKRFIVAPCENINNALAIIDDGMRYILYDPKFINSISQTSNYWANMSILAHEVGHHINGHTLGSSISAYENKIQELEADEFSGFVMQKIGANLEQSIDAIASISASGDDTYSSHPNKSRRIKAITKGFNNAKNNSFITEKKLTDWEEYYFRGNEKYDAEDYEGAIEDYTESIKLKPSEDAYFSRSRSKGKLDDNSGAKYDLIRSIELNEKSWKSHYYLGLNLADIDNFGSLSAFKTYLKLTDYSADFYDSWTYYYITKSYLNEGFYKKALEYINHTLNESNFESVIDRSNQHFFYNQRGDVYFELENYDLARKDYEKASELDPEKALYVELIGDTYAKEKKHKKAIEFYDQALILDPDKYSIYEYRAYAYEALENYFNALLDMNEAIKHKSDYAYLYFKRGEYSSKLDDKKNSCTDWLKARELGSEEALKSLIEICGYTKENFYTADDYMNLAVEKNKKGDYDESLLLINKAEELGYKDLYFLESYKYSYFYNKKQYDLALGVLMKIKDDTSTYSSSSFWWTRNYLLTLYELENFSELTSVTKELINENKLDPDVLEYKLNSDFITKNTDFVLDIYISYFNSYYLSKEYDKAIIVSSKMIKVGKTITEASEILRLGYQYRSDSKLLKEDYLGALQDINENIKMREEWSLGYIISGKIKLAMGKTNYACDDFKKALQVSLKNENEGGEDQQEIQKLIDDNCK